MKGCANLLSEVWDLFEHESFMTYADVFDGDEVLMR